VVLTNVSMFRLCPKPWVGYLWGYSSDTYGKKVCGGYTRGHGKEICEVIVMILTERKYVEVMGTARCF
jgi:hypothetical protein